MDLNVIFAPLIEFLHTDLGKIVGIVTKLIYGLLYPANAVAAHVEDAAQAVTVKH